MIKRHPLNRLERRRSAQAKALESALFRQKRIEGKKKKVILTIQEKEYEDELRRTASLNRQHQELD